VINKKDTKIKRNADGSRAAPSLTQEDRQKKEAEKERLKKRNPLFKKWAK
jgi:hypothetical protein